MPQGKPAQAQPFTPGGCLVEADSGWEAATAAQTSVDATVGVALEISKDLPKLASNLRGFGGLFAFAGVSHGILTGDYEEAGWGVLDLGAVIASAFPVADIATGPYFATRLGMGLGSSRCVCGKAAFELRAITHVQRNVRRVARLLFGLRKQAGGGGLRGGNDAVINFLHQLWLNCDSK